MTLDELYKKLDKVAEQVSLVEFPEKKDPDWPVYSARGIVDGVSYMGRGDTREQALEDLLKNIEAKKPAVGFGR